jgi:hypothetical protein
MQIQTIDPKDLTIFANERDILRDMYIYLDYIEQRGIKRMARSNDIPKSDAVKIAKLLGDPELVKIAQESGGTAWGILLDKLAHQLALIDYDTKGEYIGYSSSTPTFTDNYVTINKSGLKNFNALTPAAQEKKILANLLVHTVRELENYGALSTLAPLRTYGTHLDQVKFQPVRQFLLNLFKKCVPDVWYSTASLVAYLKTNHPYFLLPENLPANDRFGTPMTRYKGIRETYDYSNKDEILEGAGNAFERVEGRYVERFLENIPLILRFVEVAYDPNAENNQLGLDQLKAFRVNERFLRLMSGAESTPKVTVQPNFDVVIESDFYPAGVIQQMGALGEQMSSPNSGHGAYVGIFQLKKAAVAAAQVKNPDLDVIALLKSLSGRALPSNVQIELDEWAGHADQFTLYEGFSILESVDEIPEADEFTTERISPSLCLVRNSGKLFSMLEALGCVPLRVWHQTGELALIAETAVSVFPTESAADNAPLPARPIKVRRVVTVSYQFPDAESFESIQKMLAELRCPFHADSTTRTVSLQQKEQDKFDEAVQHLQDAYAIEIE